MNQDTIQKVFKYINDDQVVRFTQDFVRINSVNPNLEPGSTETEGAFFLADACRDAGLQVRMEETAPGRSNLYVVLPGAEEGIGLSFMGHLDTVPFLGMKNPLSAEIQSGTIWGRGAVDMKGGLAASVQALIALAHSGVRLRKGVAVWAVIDEESEHRGAYALEEGNFQADACICTEPSGMDLTLGHKGTAPIRIDFKGVLAHGSVPWLGANAIEMASKVVLALKQIEPKEFYIPELDLTIQGTINVGVISGGSQYNNVADSCSLFLDRRTVLGENQASILEEIKEILDRFAAEDPKFAASAEVSRPDWHWEPIRMRGLNPSYTPATSRIAQVVQSSFRRLLGQEVKLGFANGYMDMDFTVNGLNIPTVRIGPGDSKYCHSIDERLSITDLLNVTRIYVLCALELAN